MKTLLYIAIFTTAVVLSWVVFGFYHSKTTTTISSDKEIIITPIPPEFDEETVGKIRLRKVIEADLSTNRKIASGGATIIETPIIAEEPIIQEEPIPTTTESVPTIELPAPSL